MRGDVHLIKLPVKPGHEQRGRRLGVVIQSENLHLSTWLMAPTSTSAQPASFRPTVLIGDRETYVLVEQLLAVDVETRVGQQVGRLTFAEMLTVDTALHVVLGLAR